MGIIVSLLVNTIAVLAAGYILPQVTIDAFSTAILVALVMGFINAFIKPILKILTLPITIVTLGLFSFVLNALLILVVDWLISGFSVGGFIGALLFSLVLTIVGWILNKIGQ